MLIRDFLPAPAVRSFIQCYRIVHLEFSKDETIPFKALPPKPEQCLHFFLRDPITIESADTEKLRYPSILMTGQRTSLIKLFNGRNLLNVQIVFQPMAVFKLTGIPAYELTNRYVDATGIFKNIQATFGRLQSAIDYVQLIHMLNNYSKKLVCNVRKDALPLDFVGSQMMRSGGTVSMDWLAKESCLCPRQFRRKFYERTGVNPKTYARIIHFTRVYNFKNWYPTMDWQRIASVCGYADYQHLVKDYKEFTGLTPTELHLLERAAPENVLGLTKGLYYNRFKATL
ncbi:MAG: helix-turn-helix domain-containing protein [Segetibacter sp.]